MEITELPKEAKIQALKKAVSLLNDYTNHYMCPAIGGRNNLNCGNGCVTDKIPEFTFEKCIELARLHKFKKPECRAVWWDDDSKGRKRRITFLNLLVKEMEYIPKLVAKLVVTTFVTKVIVPENATFDQIMTATLPRLSEQLITDLDQNIDDIINDLEMPYEQLTLNLN